MDAQMKNLLMSCPLFESFYCCTYLWTKSFNMFTFQVFNYDADLRYT